MHRFRRLLPVAALIGAATFFGSPVEAAKEWPTELSGRPPQYDGPIQSGKTECYLWREQEDDPLWRFECRSTEGPKHVVVRIWVDKKIKEPEGVNFDPGDGFDFNSAKNFLSTHFIVDDEPKGFTIKLGGNQRARFHVVYKLTGSRKQSKKGQPFDTNQIFIGSEGFHPDRLPITFKYADDKN